MNDCRLVSKVRHLSAREVFGSLCAKTGRYLSPMLSFVAIEPKPMPVQEECNLKRFVESDLRKVDFFTPVAQLQLSFTAQQIQLVLQTA